MATRVKKTGKLVIPEFPKTIRDEILNYTDDKDHKSFIKLLDSKKMFKIISGAKGVSKSFGVMIHTIWRMVNEPNYCAVWARNLSKDINNTVRATLMKALDFLKVIHKIDLTNLFDIYQTSAFFKPTGQAIFFCNFELVNSFAGLTMSKFGHDICDVVFDEIQQNPDELGSSREKIYAKQPNDMEFIKQSTILRTPRKSGQLRSMIFLFNVYDSKHWVCEKYVNPVLPFNKENRDNLNKSNYLFFESEELDCSIMRMSRFYVPKSEVDEYQMRSYEQLKKDNPKLYDITIAGEPYDLETSTYIYPFKKYIYSDNNIDESIISTSEIDLSKTKIVIDGYDPGLRDRNGFVRIAITEDFKILVYYAEEISSNKFTHFKRTTMTEYLLAFITFLNERAKIKESILAIDSREDTIIELVIKSIQENNLSIRPCKAIKNKNPNFTIDFNISNRSKFLLECLQKKIIRFTPQTFKLIEYISLQAFDGNWKRDEKINPHIYDLINAFEYGLSIVYPLIISNNILDYDR